MIRKEMDKDKLAEVLESVFGIQVRMWNHDAEGTFTGIIYDELYSSDLITPNERKGASGTADGREKR